MSLNVQIQELNNRIDNLENLLSAILEHNAHLENIISLQGDQIKILRTLIEMDFNDGK